VRAKQRLFFALWPDDSVRAQVTARAARAIEAAAKDGGKIVVPANYHVTLAFLGAVSSSSVADVVAAAAWVRFLPFELSLERTGYWPRSLVAWLAPAATPAPLEALVDDLWHKLIDIGLHRKSLRYQPHLTLNRKARGGIRMALDAPVNWPVASFALVESVTAETGPVYTVLEEFVAGA
jgi:2'-5' RNA ligase